MKEATKWLRTQLISGWQWVAVEVRSGIRKSTALIPETVPLASTLVSGFRSNIQPPTEPQTETTITFRNSIRRQCVIESGLSHQRYACRFFNSRTRPTFRSHFDTSQSTRPRKITPVKASTLNMLCAISGRLCYRLLLFGPFFLSFLDPHVHCAF